MRRPRSMRPQWLFAISRTKRSSKMSRLITIAPSPNPAPSEARPWADQPFHVFPNCAILEGAHEPVDRFDHVVEHVAGQRREHADPERRVRNDVGVLEVADDAAGKPRVCGLPEEIAAEEQAG